MKTKFHKYGEFGYTLIELIAVVVLLSIVSGFFISKFDLNNSWGTDSAVREFANKIEFLMQDAGSRQVNYQIEIFPNGTGYRVWQIARKVPNQTVQVDLLKNLRSKKHQAEEEQKNAGQALNQISEEYKKDEQINRLPINLQYYLQIFDDPSDSSRKIAPLEYPSLVSGTNFPPSLRVKSVNNNLGRTGTQDINNILISSAISAPDAEVILESDKETISISIKPFQRLVKLRYQS